MILKETYIPTQRFLDEGAIILKQAIKDPSRTMAVLRIIVIVGVPSIVHNYGEEAEGQVGGGSHEEHGDQQAV